MPNGRPGPGRYRPFGAENERYRTAGAGPGRYRMVGAETERCGMGGAEAGRSLTVGVLILSVARCVAECGSRPRVISRWTVRAYNWRFLVGSGSQWEQ